MYKDFAWNEFLKTGNIQTYMEFKALENMIFEKKGETIDEANKGERDSNTRSSIQR